MPTGRHVLALLKTHFHGEDQEFLSVAMQVAAQEARQGHTKLAEQIRELVDKSKLIRDRGPQKLIVLEPKGDLANLISLQEPTVLLSSLVLPIELEKRLKRVLLEYRQHRRLHDHGLHPRRKLLFIGPPGTGKTSTAATLAGELHLPLFVTRLDSIITKFMGETATKLRLIFDAMALKTGVYLFDEFDAIGTRRTATNDVGEIRRVLNSFLQFLEKDSSNSIIIATTNHPDLLDGALFRRFDDIIEFPTPTREVTKNLIRNRLGRFELLEIKWPEVLENADGLSQAELVRACDDAAKATVLLGSSVITHNGLLATICERKKTHPPNESR